MDYPKVWHNQETGKEVVKAPEGYTRTGPAAFTYRTGFGVAKGIADGDLSTQTILRLQKEDTTELLVRAVGCLRVLPESLVFAEATSLCGAPHAEGSPIPPPTILKRMKPKPGEESFAFEQRVRDETLKYVRLIPSSFWDEFVSGIFLTSMPPVDYGLGVEAPAAGAVDPPA